MIPHLSFKKTLPIQLSYSEFETHFHHTYDVEMDSLTYTVKKLGEQLQTKGVGPCIAFVAKIFGKKDLKKVAIFHYSLDNNKLEKFFKRITRLNQTVHLYIFGGNCVQTNDPIHTTINKLIESNIFVTCVYKNINPFELESYSEYQGEEAQLDDFYFDIGISKDGTIYYHQNVPDNWSIDSSNSDY